MTPSNVLIVEDEAIVQMHLERIVSQIGHKVIGTVATLQGALEAAALQAPELVLMDISLSGGDDGVEAARLLSDRYGCATIFVTAYADSETLARSEGAGAVGYVVKPFAEGQLLSAVATAVSQAGAKAPLGERPEPRPPLGAAREVDSERVERLRKVATLLSQPVTAEAGDQRVLTERELEVVRLLLNNGRVASIARGLAARPKS